MAQEQSLVLIRRAKNGDREAWEELLTRYYPMWCRKFHGQIGTRLRSLYETQDVVQSALAQALREIGALRSEDAFFSWVSAIVRRKIAAKHRRSPRAARLSLSELGDNVKERSAERLPAITEEEYLRFLDSLIDGFSTYPDQMAVVYLKYFEELDLAALARTIGKSERTVQRLLQQALEILGRKCGLA